MSRKIYPNQTVYAIYVTLSDGTEEPCNFSGVLVESPYCDKRRASEVLWLVKDLSQNELFVKCLKWGEFQQDLIKHDSVASYKHEIEDYIGRQRNLF